MRHIKCWYNKKKKNIENFQTNLNMKETDKVSEKNSFLLKKFPKNDVVHRNKKYKSNRLLQILLKEKQKNEEALQKNDVIKETQIKIEETEKHSTEKSMETHVKIEENETNSKEKSIVDMVLDIKQSLMHYFILKQYANNLMSI